MAFKKDINVMWFRQDLRLADNPALSKSLEDGKTLPIFILDNVNSKDHSNGAASKWWLHQSLIELNKSLKIFNVEGLKPITLNLSKVPNSIGSLS